MQAYTYSIQHIRTKIIYYGVRKSDHFDLGISYFSSSKLIKRMIEEEGNLNFIFKLRKKFESYEQAREHESKILRRLNAVKNPLMFNQSVSSPRLCAKDSVAEFNRRESISKRMKELWKTEEYRNSQSFHKISHEERIKRGGKGAQKRIENYNSGKTLKKPKTDPVYSEVEIIKNGIIKSVKSNQVPAYVKCGWARR